MHVCEHNSVLELKRLAKLEKRAAMVRRLQVVILAQQGQTAPQIVEATGVGRRAVQEWVRRYNVDGLTGLTDRRSGGNRRYLSTDQEEQVCQYLDHVAADLRNSQFDRKPEALPAKPRLANRQYADYKTLCEAACYAWQATCLDAELIRSVCKAPYIHQRKVKA